MAINGPSDFQTPDFRQIHNFLKLCIANVDFSSHGLFRKDGSQLHLQYFNDHVLPLLKDFDFTIEELTFTFSQEAAAAADCAGAAMVPKLKLLKDDSINSDLADDKQPSGKKEERTALGYREKTLQSLRATMFELFAQNHSELGNLYLSLIEQSKLLVKSNKQFLDHPYGLSIQKQLSNLFNDYKSWTRYVDVRYSDDTEKSPVQMQDPAYLTETVRLQLALISFLYKQQSLQAAEYLHNTMHLCFLAAGASAENTPFVIGKMMGMCTWVLPFGLIDKLDDMGIGGKQLATYAACFIEVGLSHGQFARPFEQNTLFYARAIETIETIESDSCEMARTSLPTRPQRKLSLKSIFKRGRSNSSDASASMSTSPSTEAMDELSQLLSRTTLHDFYAVSLTDIDEGSELSGPALSSDDSGSFGADDSELLPSRSGTPRAGDHLRKANLRDKLLMSDKSLEQCVRVTDGVTEVTNPLYGKKLPTKLTNKPNQGRPRQ